ncbi:MAG TPA: hypothetical protein DCS19_05075 [Flavobacterium sp.]|nr:hypothetical protein [Flavobacterium sp.]
MEKTAKQTKTYKSVVIRIINWVKKNTIIEPADYSRWYVGVTNNPKVRKQGHKSKFGKEPYCFNPFYARTKNIALEIETYFHQKGMKEKDLKGNVKENSWYVYVFKKNKSFLDKIKTIFEVD